jgi:hypothetical protein
MSNLTPIPEPTHLVHVDGTIQVCVADICGTVSSWHLVEPKEHQLTALWLERSSSALRASSTKEALERHS